MVYRPKRIDNLDRSSGHLPSLQANWATNPTTLTNHPGSLANLILGIERIEVFGTGDSDPEVTKAKGHKLLDPQS